MQVSKLDRTTRLDSLHKAAFQALSTAQTLVVKFPGIARTNFLGVWSPFRIIWCFIKIQILGLYPNSIESESLEDPRNLPRVLIFFLVFTEVKEPSTQKAQSSYMSTKGTIRKGGVEKSMGRWYVIASLPHPPSAARKGALRAEASKQSYHWGPVGLLLPLSQKQASVAIGVNLIYHFLAGIKV